MEGKGDWKLVTGLALALEYEINDLVLAYDRLITDLDEVRQRDGGEARPATGLQRSRTAPAIGTDPDELARQLSHVVVATVQAAHDLDALRGIQVTPS